MESPLLVIDACWPQNKCGQSGNRYLQKYASVKGVCFQETDASAISRRIQHVGRGPLQVSPRLRVPLIFIL